MKDIQSAVARAFGPGGRVISVQASSGIPGVASFKNDLRHEVHKAVAMARLAEPVEDLCQPLLLVSRVLPAAPGPTDPHLTVTTRLLETAAVLADRAARGLMRMPAQGFVAMAQCQDWTKGQLLPLEPAWAEQCMQALINQPDLGEVQVVLAGTTPDIDECTVRIRQQHPSAVVRAADSLLHFSGSLSGLRRPRAAEVLFPVLAGPGGGALNVARVAVSPLPPGNAEEASITVVGSNDLGMVDRAKWAVQTVRKLESPSSRRWQTVIHLPPTSVDGGSFELAVVVADRIARGREWPGPGKVMATGAIDWKGGSGRVGHVENEWAGSAGSPNSGAGVHASKTQLMASELMPNDTVLVPTSWLRGVKDISALGQQVVFLDHVVERSEA
jgi:hypothetical protein